MKIDIVPPLSGLPPTSQLPPQQSNQGSMSGGGGGRGGGNGVPWTWTLESNTPTLGRTYSRPFGMNEYGFYYDCLFHGAADCYQRFVCSTKESDVFSEENVGRAWATLKQRCPLLGARWEVRDEVEDVRFVVEERFLEEHPSGQMTFVRVRRGRDVDAYVERLMNGPQRDFCRFPARVFVFSLGGEEEDDDDDKEKEKAGVHHVVLQISHVVSDATCMATIARTFLDALVSPPYGVPDLEERLAKVVRAEDLNPARALSVPRQRWRRAIAGVIHRLRDAGVQGGHPLPRTLTWDTYHTIPTRGFTVLEFPPALTTHMLTTCRLRKYTLGSAISVLSQLASACAFYRSHLRGEWTREELDRAVREPMHQRGARSLRPFAERGWWEGGGLTEVFCCISFFCVTLPFVPLLSPLALSSLAPLLDGNDNDNNNNNEEEDDRGRLWEALMSRDRFALRCQMIRRQFKDLMRHPLFWELTEEQVRSVVAHKRRVFKRWRRAMQGLDPYDGFTASGLKEGMVYTSEWTSVGSYDIHVSLDYPIPPSNPAYWRPNTPRVLEAPAPESPEAEVASTMSLSSSSIIPDSAARPSSAIISSVTAGSFSLPLPPQAQAQSQAPTITTTTSTTACTAPPSEVLLHVQHFDGGVKARPTDIYLAAVTMNGVLRISLMYDLKVYAPGMIERWMGDIRDAAGWYLGREEGLPVEARL